MIIKLKGIIWLDSVIEKINENMVFPLRKFIMFFKVVLYFVLLRKAIVEVKMYMQF